MKRRVPADPVAMDLAEQWYVVTHEDLWRNAAEEQAAGIGTETDEYLALNRVAWEAREKVRWWREPFLNWRVRRNLAKDGIRI